MRRTSLRREPVGFPQCWRAVRAVQDEHRLAALSPDVDMRGAMVSGIDHHAQSIEAQDGRHGGSLSETQAVRNMISRPCSLAQRMQSGRDGPAPIFLHPQQKTWPPAQVVQAGCPALATRRAAPQARGPGRVPPRARACLETLSGSLCVARRDASGRFRAPKDPENLNRALRAVFRGLCG